MSCVNLKYLYIARDLTSFRHRCSSNFNLFTTLKTRMNLFFFLTSAIELNGWCSVKKGECLFENHKAWTIKVKLYYLRLRNPTKRTGLKNVFLLHCLYKNPYTNLTSQLQYSILVIGNVYTDLGKKRNDCMSVTCIFI